MRLLLTSLFLLGAALPALAQEAPPIGIELNRLEPQGAACRVWMVSRNPGPDALDPLRLDLIVFGKDGVIARRMALDLGPLPGRKTQARIFDLAGQSCDSLGSLLVNDVMACGPTAETKAACLSRLSLSSRADGVSFDQ